MKRIAILTGAVSIIVAVSLATPLVASAAAPTGTLCFIRKGELWGAVGAASARRIATLPSAKSYSARHAGDGQVLVECSSGDWTSDVAPTEGFTTKFTVVSLDGVVDDLGQGDAAAVSGKGLLAFAAGGNLLIGNIHGASSVGKLPDKLVHAFEWSHDSTKLLLVASSPESGGGHSQDQLWVYDVAKRSYKQLTSNRALEDMGGNASIRAAHFSADDSVIGYVQGRRSDSRYISFVRPDGSTPTWATDAHTIGCDGPFDFAHTGSAIAFSLGNLDRANYQTQNLIYLLENVADSPESARTLTAKNGCDFEVAFSPDDGSIAFSHFSGDRPYPTSASHIWVMARDGSGAHEVSAGASPVWVGAAALVVPPGMKDSDGDGLPDEWEIKGADTNNDGKIEIDLPKMGANPLRKDLFLQIDWMEDAPTTIVGDWKTAGHRHKPKSGALARVVRAFADAPIENPDGSHGITLHIDAGPDSVMTPSGTKWGSLGMGGSIAEVKMLGKAKPTSTVWSDFDEIKARRVSAARAQVFHYCIFAHAFHDADGDNFTGLSEFVPGGDFIVAEGAGGGSLDELEQAGTLMHEFGHNLGLWHGGGDYTNYKPNYLSVMNYSFQLTGLRKDGRDGYLDYSRDKLSALDEHSLDEASGVGPRELVGSLGTKYWANGVGATVWGPLAGPEGRVVDYLSHTWVDWNGNGGAPEDNIQVDINTPPSTDTKASIEALHGFDDWSHIQFTGGPGHVIGATGAAGSARSLPGPAEQSKQDFVDQGLVLYEYDVRVKAPSMLGFGAGTPSIPVQFAVQNAGNATDTYTLSLALPPGAQTTASLVPLTVSPHTTQTVDVALTGVPRATSRAPAEVTLRAESKGNPLIADEAAVALFTEVAAATPPGFSGGGGPADNSATLLIGLALVAVAGGIGWSVFAGRKNADSSSDPPDDPWLHS